MNFFLVDIYDNWYVLLWETFIVKGEWRGRVNSYGWNRMFFNMIVLTDCAMLWLKP